MDEAGYASADRNDNEGETGAWFHHYERHLNGFFVWKGGLTFESLDLNLLASIYSNAGI